MLVACSELQPSVTPLRGTLSDTRRALDVARGSWVSPEAKREDLLYVSDQLFSEVYVFSYPGLDPVGTLTGFNLPEGICTDKRGDVFVTDLLARRVVEYEHGGSEPIRTLDDGGYPQGCSVDPSTGDLAVADYGSSGSPGEIAVFHKARGAPALYRDATMISFANCGYDGSGNLFADGQKYGNDPGLAELPLHAGKLRDLDLGRDFDGEGSVQWDGRHVAIMGNSPKRIYRLAIVGSKAKIVGHTTITPPKYSLSFWIRGNRLILTYIPPHSRDTALAIWSYPDGGAPRKGIRPLVGVYGLAISVARQHRRGGNRRRSI